MRKEEQNSSIRIEKQKNKEREFLRMQNNQIESLKISMEFKCNKIIQDYKNKCTVMKKIKWMMEIILEYQIL